MLHKYDFDNAADMTGKDVLKLAGYVVKRCAARAMSDGYTSTWYKDCREDAMQVAALAWYEYHTAPILERCEKGPIYAMCRAVGREAYKWTARGNAEYIARNYDPTPRTYDPEYAAVVYEIYKYDVLARVEKLTAVLRKDYAHRVYQVAEEIVFGNSCAKKSKRVVATARKLIWQAAKELHAENIE